MLVRDGFIGREPRRRQRWRCRDRHDPADFHRFVPPVPRLESLEHRCLDCESHLDIAQGPNAPRRYDFVAREVASTLVSLANGATYMQAAFTARTTVAAQFNAADRDLPWNDVGMTHGQAAADWVGVFTDVVLADDEDDHWPPVLLLDSTSFWRRQGGRRVPAFHVLMAYGYDEGPTPAPLPSRYDLDGQLEDDDFDIPWAQLSPPVRNGRLLRAEVFPRSDKVSWTDFLSSWPGTPQVIVADRAQEIRAAVQSTWPAGLGLRRPELVACRWHMAKNLRENLVEDLVALNVGPGSERSKKAAAAEHPLVLDVERAFDSPRAFRQYRDRACTELDYAYLRLHDDGKLTGARRWLKDNELAVIAQQERRPFRPGPESTGPLEAEIHNMRGVLGRRAQTLRNQPRTNLLLRLVVAGRRGLANERTWAEKVRRYLVALDGIPQQQRRLVERLGHSSL